MDEHSDRFFSTISTYFGPAVCKLHVRAIAVAAAVRAFYFRTQSRCADHDGPFTPHRNVHFVETTVIYFYVRAFSRGFLFSLFGTIAHGVSNNTVYLKHITRLRIYIHHRYRVPNVCARHTITVVVMKCTRRFFFFFCN